MKKILLVPDSFKGTMCSTEICAIMQGEILRHFPGMEVISIPAADGGEGTAEAFLTAMGGQWISVEAKGPYLEDRTARYALLKDGTAVIEMAACAGLPLVGENRRAEKTSTYGVGLLMRDALERGCRRIILGLGGSATNDMGAGAAAALGVTFLDREGKSFLPLGESLSRVEKIDCGPARKALGDTELVCICDIDNPLCGPRGAAYVFAPQKGADSEMVRFLDSQLSALAGTIRRELHQEIASLPGAGAAGGMGGGMAAFLGAALKPGIETLLDGVGFDRLAQDADLVFTGEGKLDSQSLGGKVVVGVARRCKKQNLPVIAVVGDIGDGIEGVYEEGVTAVFSINRIAADFSKVRSRCREDLRLTMDSLMRLLKTSLRLP